MTERQDGGLEERLGQWFEHEVEQARADLRRGSIVPASARPPRRSSRVGLAVAAVILAVVAIGVPLATGRWTETDPAPVPSAPVSPHPSTEPPSFVDVDITGWYGDGVPASIDGRPVDRPGLSGLDAGLSDLKGGWVVDGPGWACERPADEPCLRTWLANAPSGDGQLMIPGVEEILQPGWIAVYRLAADVLDPEGMTTATLVWAADPATFISDRFGGGIPLHVGGEAVVPVAELVDTVAGLADDRSVLVGGWAWQVLNMRCQATVGDQPALLPRCNPRMLSSAPGGATGDDASGIPLVPMTGFSSIPLITDELAFADGMVVLRVHGHDARVADCPQSSRDDCDAAIVVDEIVWSGDEWTGTEPLSIDDVMWRLGRAGIEVTVQPRDRFGGACPADWPPQTWTAAEAEAGDPASSHVGVIGVFATTADRERVEATLDPHGLSRRMPGGERCGIIIDSVGGHRWVGISNVIVGVPFRWDEPEADVAARVDRVREAFANR